MIKLKPGIFFMKFNLSKRIFMVAVLLSFVIGTVPSNAQNNRKNESSNFEISAYLASYNHFAPPGGNWGNIPTKGIDWTAFDCLNYFALNVKRNGSFSEIKAYKNMSPDRITAAVTAAHKAGKPVLITIGGWGNYKGFSHAIRPSVRAKFVNNLVQLVDKWNFDGIDLDMEPIKKEDTGYYMEFVNTLHDALGQVKTPFFDQPVITAVTGHQPHMFAKIQDKLSRIKIMTYDMSGAWSGWVTWHNDPIYNGGLKFPGRDKYLPSVNKMVDRFLNAGIEPHKILIGIDFYGYVWNGVSKPGEQWNSKPSVKDNIPYRKLYKRYSLSESHWDNKAKASYLSIQRPGKKVFVSYDNSKAVQAKIDYARNKNLGGVFVWDLSAGYLKDNPSGKRNPLLKPLKKADNQ